MIIGVDPGLDGAICFLQRGGPKFFSMPTRKLSSTRREIDPIKLAEILALAPPGVIAVFEEVTGDRKFGGSRAVTFGKACGIAQALLEVRPFNVVRARPNVWKRQLLGPDTSKESSIRYVKRKHRGVNLIPPGKRSESHDWAEACCLAHWGARHG